MVTYMIKLSSLGVVGNHGDSISPYDFRPVHSSVFTCYKRMQRNKGHKSRGH